MIEVFDDRVDITNPGGLVSTIPPNEFGFRSHSRNPLIFGLFERMHLVEQIGSGISRIREEMHKRNLPDPEFKTEGLFTVQLQRLSRTSGGSSERLVDKLVDRLGDTQVEILKLVSSDRTVSKSKMAKKLSISTTAVDNHVRKLREMGILIRKGGNKGGWWVINETPL